MTTTVAWPTTRPFMPQALTVGVDVRERMHTGFYSGNRTRLSTLAERMRAQLTLGPCSATDAASREAFVLGHLLSLGGYTTFGPYHRPHAQGTIGGSVTASSSAAAGARSLALAGITARPNLMLGGSFEVDTDANGRADHWTAYSAGTTGAVTYSRSGGAVHGSWRQRVAAAGLGTATTDRAGIYQQVTAPAVGSTVTLSAYVIADASGTPTATINCTWYDAGASVISDMGLNFAPSSASIDRYSVSGVVPAGAVTARVFVWVQERTGSAGAAAIEIDAVQLEVGASASAFATAGTLAAGDYLSVGNNLIQVGYAGATATDAGTATVPLMFPLPAAVSSSAAVTWLSPTGTWELDADAIDIDYVAPRLQQALVLPFRQVVV